MKNKFLVITSLIMTFILIFACIGCSASTSNSPSIDEYMNNKIITIEKSNENRRSDEFKTTTIIGSQEIEKVERINESYEKDGETITVTYAKKEEKLLMNFIITYEVKDGIVKFNQTIKATQTLITRSLNENKEIVEVKEEVVMDEFHDLVYVDDEMRLYKFNNVNPEKSCYMIRNEDNIRSLVGGYITTANYIIQESSTAYGKGFLYKDGAYVGVEVPNSSNTIINSTINVSYAKSAMDKNGNIKAETYQILNTSLESQESKISYEIKYGGSFKSRDITNIPEEEPIIL